MHALNVCLTYMPSIYGWLRRLVERLGAGVLGEVWSGKLEVAPAQASVVYMWCGVV